MINQVTDKATGITYSISLSHDIPPRGHAEREKLAKRAGVTSEQLDYVHHYSVSRIGGDGYHLTDGAELDVLLFANRWRGCILHNAGVDWTDAESAGEVLFRFITGTMIQ